MSRRHPRARAVGERFGQANPREDEIHGKDHLGEHG